MNAQSNLMDLKMTTVKVCKVSGVVQSVLFHKIIPILLTRIPDALQQINLILIDGLWDSMFLYLLYHSRTIRQ